MVVKEKRKSDKQLKEVIILITNWFSIVGKIFLAFSAIYGFLFGIVSIYIISIKNHWDITSILLIGDIWAFLVYLIFICAIAILICLFILGIKNFRRKQ